MKILAVNPGSTSTKIAVYEDETPRLVLNIRHSVEELSQMAQTYEKMAGERLPLKPQLAPEFSREKAGELNGEFRI